MDEWVALLPCQQIQILQIRDDYTQREGFVSEGNVTYATLHPFPYICIYTYIISSEVRQV
jgi:hypothetical protein